MQEVEDSFVPIAADQYTIIVSGAGPCRSHSFGWNCRVRTGGFRAKPQSLLNEHGARAASAGYRLIDTEAPKVVSE